MADIEAVKREGVRKALFDATNTSLWMARRALEHAGEQKDGSFADFLTHIAQAKTQLDDAEAFYFELLRAKGEK